MEDLIELQRRAVEVGDLETAERVQRMLNSLQTLQGLLSE